MYTNRKENIQMLFTQETNQKNGIEELEDRQNPKNEMFEALQTKKTSLSFFKFDEKLAMFLRNLFIGMSKQVVILPLSVL